jgi:hypothetical protein
MPCLTDFLSYMYLHNTLGRNYILVLNMSYLSKKGHLVCYECYVIIYIIIC